MLLMLVFRNCAPDALDAPAPSILPDSCASRPNAVPDLTCVQHDDVDACHSHSAFPWRTDEVHSHESSPSTDVPVATFLRIESAGETM